MIREASPPKLPLHHEENSINPEHYRINFKLWVKYWFQLLPRWNKVQEAFTLNLEGKRALTINWPLSYDYFSRNAACEELSWVKHHLTGLWLNLLYYYLFSLLFCLIVINPQTASWCLCKAQRSVLGPHIGLCPVGFRSGKAFQPQVHPIPCGLLYNQLLCSFLTSLYR